MNKTLRYTLKGAGIAASLLLLFWLIILWYVSANKQQIISKISGELGEQMNATITIGDLDPSFFQTFPFLSLRLSKISLRDSLWHVHHQDFLKAEKFFIRVNPFSLLSPKPQINKIIVDGGSIYIFTDSSRYTNAYILNPKKKKTRKGIRPPFDEIELKNVRLQFIHPSAAKRYDFDIRKLSCEVDSEDSLVSLGLKMDILVHHLAFNSDRGSFLREKRVEGKFEVLLGDKTIQVNKIPLRLDRQPFVVSARFNLGEASSFSLDISSRKAPYKRLTGLLTKRLAAKLDRFDMTRTVDVRARLNGSLLPKTIPRILIDWTVRNSDLKTPIGEFTDVSFNGSFDNQQDSLLAAVDSNSVIRADAFTGNWENIRLSSKKIRIIKLEEPQIAFDLHTSIDLEKLNALGGAESFDFHKGKGEVNVNYSGPITEGDKTPTEISGNIDIDGGEITYRPRNLLLSRCKGSLIFDKQHVYVKDLRAFTKKSDLLVNGKVQNLLSALNLATAATVIDLDLRSEKLDLGDFTQNLRKRNSAARSDTKARFVDISNRLDKLIEQAAMNIEIDAKKVSYKRFDASVVKASILLDNDEWNLRKISLNHADGSIAVKGKIKTDGENNPFQISGNMQHIDISKVFYAFNNFSIDGLTDKNLKGDLTADFDISAFINGEAEILPYSTSGWVNISLKNGALQNFEPMQKISNSVFKNRDMSDIRFAELKDHLDINGSSVTVNSLEIQSTVLSMFIEGVYDFKTGPDLSILIPLSNLKKRDADFELVNKGTESKKGISVHLRARNGDDGKVKIAWDPFKRAIKNKEKKMAGE